MKRLGRSLMQFGVATAIGLAALLAVAVVFAAFGWTLDPYLRGFIEGLAFTRAYLDTLRSPWLTRSLDRWWGP